MRRFVLWFFLAGCPQPGDGTGGGVTQEDPDGDPPVESDEPPAASDTAAPCAPTGFAADPVIWALPSAWGDALFDPYDAGAMIGNCQAGRPSWLLERMTPDYLPDLVVTQEACAEGPVGRTRWDVYEALPEGAFSEAPIVWTLPPVYQDARYDPFAGPNTIGDCVQGPPTLGLLDMNGDFYADLVVFDEPCLSGPLGAERWDVYLNDGSGFEERPVAWELPRGFGGTLFDPFPLAWNVPSCANEAPGYRLLDMDGDFLPDLVVTQEPCLDGPLGRARWDVYRNTGAGFAATPTPWRLPDAWSGALRDPLADVEGEARCQDGAPAFGLAQLTDDYAPDLVIFDEPCLDGPLGRARWEVYVAGPDGLASSPLAWSLPQGFDDALWDPFAGPASDGNCQSGRPRYRLENYLGHLADDLVILDEPCASGPLGRYRWDIHEALGAGFSPDPHAWSLPMTWDDALLDPLSHEARTHACNEGWPTYTTQDLTEDWVSDLVIHDEPCSGPIGRTHWEVYPAVCGP